MPHWPYIHTQAVRKTASVCAAASASQSQSCSAHGSWKATWKRTCRTWQRTPSRFFRQRAAVLWRTCGSLYEMEVLYRGKQIHLCPSLSVGTYLKDLVPTKSGTQSFHWNGFQLPVTFILPLLLDPRADSSLSFHCSQTDLPPHLSLCSALVTTQTLMPVHVTELTATLPNW